MGQEEIVLRESRGTTMGGVGWGVSGGARQNIGKKIEDGQTMSKNSGGGDLPQPPKKQDWCQGRRKTWVLGQKLHAYGRKKRGAHEERKKGEPTLDLIHLSKEVTWVKKGGSYFG